MLLFGILICLYQFIVWLKLEKGSLAYISSIYVKDKMHSCIIQSKKLLLCKYIVECTFERGDPERVVETPGRELQKGQFRRDRETVFNILLDKCNIFI